MCVFVFFLKFISPQLPAPAPSPSPSPFPSPFPALAPAPAHLLQPGRLTSTAAIKQGILGLVQGKKQGEDPFHLKYLVEFHE